MPIFIHNEYSRTCNRLNVNLRLDTCVMRLKGLTFQPDLSNIPCG